MAVVVVVELEVVVVELEVVVLELEVVVLEVRRAALVGGVVVKKRGIS